MTLAFNIASAVNITFLLAVALCLGVGLLVAPQIHERDGRDSGEGEGIPPAFRRIADGIEEDGGA